MGYNNEFLMTLFSKSTIDKVKHQFSNGPEIVPLESYNMSFRLFRPKLGNNINLELLIQMPTGTGSQTDFHNTGNRFMQTMVTFFKPLGYYTLGKGMLYDDIEVTLLYEFEETYNQLIKSNSISSNIKVHRLSLKENAVIAAFSTEAFLSAQNYEDDSFIANGLDCDIFMTFQGFPQVFLDDRYGLQGPIAAYLLKEQGSANPIIEYKPLFDKLHSMRLLSAFKQI
jgi:hypothetical protein